ncbi:hypothetical protein [uncultured Methanobrevibacter sp.]|uniref:hypothetical protein n=1 Tax=uncultured Methanobrevibacter sp. TaxID=253161 RepID=UPI0025FBDCBD|nr:hypothetical protein [uncultured Methanobrevibacter sp.]
MTTCPVCGKEIGDEKFCPNCGSAIKNENKETDNLSTNDNNSNDNDNDNNIKYCTNCCSEIDFNAEICPKCGVRQTSSTIGKSDKSEVLALVLSLILPGLGHFYLGLPKKGIIILICAIIGVFLLFIPYVIVLIYAIYDSYKSAMALANGETVEDKLF